MPTQPGKILCVLGLCFFIFYRSSVSGPPGWVEDALEDAHGAVPSLDAPAWVLLHNRTTQISANGHSKSKVRIVTQILSVHGAARSALHEKVGFSRKMNKLKGWLIKPDRQVRELGNEEIVEMTTEQSSERHDDIRALVAQFLDASAGDVVAFEYEIEVNHIPEAFNQAHVFQQDLPVRQSKFSVKSPKGWQVHVWERNLDSVRYRTEGEFHIWEVIDLPYRPEELHMPPWDELIRVVQVSCFKPGNNAVLQFSDWNAVACWIAELNRISDVSDNKLTATVDRICLGLTAPHEKLREIAKFVRDEIRYVAISFGEGKYQPRSASSTLLHKYGDCKDKVVLFRSMLESIDIPSAPVMVQTEYTIDTNYPTPSSFNHVIAAVPMHAVSELSVSPRAVSDGWFYCDLTDVATPIGGLPVALEGRTVLRASGADWEFCRLERLKPDDFSTRIEIQARLLKDNSVTARVTITDYGDRTVMMDYIEGITTTDDQIELWLQGLSEHLASPTISEFSRMSDSDSSWSVFQVEAPEVVKEIGTLRFLRVNILDGGKPDRFPGGIRNHPVWFGHAAQIETDITWTLPPGCTANEIPGRIDATCELADITCTTEVSDSMLHLNSVLRFRGGTIPAGECEQAKRFTETCNRIHEMNAILTFQ